MLAQALEAEVDAYIEMAKDQRDENGHALIVRNGRAREREIILGAGAVDVRALPGSTTRGWTSSASDGASRA